MAAVLELPPLHERADTPIMRRMLLEIAKCSQSLIEVRLPRLTRKMAESDSEINKLVHTAEICGWASLKINSVGSVLNVSLTDSGWDMVGGKPEWMKGYS